MQQLSHAISVSLIALLLAAFYGGWPALGLCASLSLLEIILSFENALFNVEQLRHMAPKWRHRFITWGMLIAVLGMRLVLPILIVALVAFISPIAVIKMMYHEPKVYGQLLHDAHPIIASFGGFFLSQVCLTYFTKKLMNRLSSPMIVAKLARLPCALLVNLCIWLGLGVSLSNGHYMLAGGLGLALSLIFEHLLAWMERQQRAGAYASDAVKFIYLECLDMIFSLDGVIAAFGFTSDIVIIMLGLGIGAYFVRSLTLYMLEHGQVTARPELMLGAHLALSILAAGMLLGLFIHIPSFLIAGASIVTIVYCASRGTAKV